MEAGNRGKLSFTMGVINLVLMGLWIAALLLLFSWEAFGPRGDVIYPNFIAGIAFGLGSYGLSLAYLLLGRRGTEGADL